MKFIQKAIAIFFLLLLFYHHLDAQAPFTTLVKEPRILKKTKTKSGEEVFRQIEEKDASKNQKSFSTAINEANAVETEKRNVSFFTSNALSVNLVNKGNDRVSINSQVVHYKLFIANPTETNTYRLNRYNLPLLLVTKLSSSYDTINASSALDVLDYEASPFTLRIMPSFKKSFLTYTDAIYFGFYTDLRGLNIYNPEKNEYRTELVGAGGIGITYQGDGEAGTYNESGEYEPGRFSISLMLQGAIADTKVMESMFETKENVVGSIQSYFLFKVSDKSKLNLKAGYQYLFQKTRSGASSTFTLSIGM